MKCIFGENDDQCLIGWLRFVVFGEVDNPCANEGTITWVVDHNISIKTQIKTSQF